MFKIKHNLWLIIAVFVTLGFFQNCAPSRVNTTSNTSSHKEGGLLNSGNGTGYGGKVYVSILPDGETCPDGSNIKTRLVTQSETIGYFDRKLCAPILPEPVDLSSVVHYYSDEPGNSYDYLVFNNEVLSNADTVEDIPPTNGSTPPPSPPLPQTAIGYECTGFETGITRISVIETDGNYTIRFQETPILIGQPISLEFATSKVNDNPLTFGQIGANGLGHQLTIMPTLVSGSFIYNDGTIVRNITEMVCIGAVR